LRCHAPGKMQRSGIASMSNVGSWASRSATVPYLMSAGPVEKPVRRLHALANALRIGSPTPSETSRYTQWPSVKTCNRLISATEQWKSRFLHGTVPGVKSKQVRIVLAFAICLSTLARSADHECPALAEAVPLCTVLADASQYDGKETTVRGLYRSVIHGSVLMSPDCGKDLVNMRQTSDYKADKHAQTMIRSVTRKNQFQAVDVVLRGTFRVAGKGECFGQNCLGYEIEDHELLCAKAAKPLDP